MRAMDAIIEHLTTMDVGANIYAGTDVDIPAGDTPFLTINETGGPEPIGTHNSGSLKRPNFQVVARGGEYPSVAALIDSVFNLLGGNYGQGGPSITNVVLGDVFFLWVRPMGQPLSLPVDANGRVRVALNLRSCHR